MDRENLYRGKKVGTNKFVYGSLINSVDEMYILQIGNNCISKNIGLSGFWDINKPCYKVIPETVGQFTGVYDKNKVRVFEDDYVNIKNKPYNVLNPCVVTWGKKSHGWSLRCDILAKWVQVKYYSLPASKDIEVVGNIHDNYAEKNSSENRD